MYYKHYNIFEPNHPSIVDLINKRAEWDILQKSLDKCHVICSSCENIVDSLLLQMNYEQEKRKLSETPPEDNTEQWTLYRDDFNEKMEEIIQSLSGLYTNSDSL